MTFRRQGGRELRQQFLLRPDVVFLNHGSFGACPRPVFEEYQRWQLELERQPVEFLGRRFSELLRAARETLAAYLSADPLDVVYVPNATFGINVVARSLRLEPGDEVLSTDHEYGAMDRTWQFVCQKQGARYITQPIPLPVESTQAVVEAIWAGVTPRTRVLFLSHITSPTALILPVAELVRRAREAGIVSIVDGAHAVGQVPVAVDELDADVYVGNLHKWVCAPKGSGFLHARREIQPLLEPLVISWGWENRLDRSFVEEQEWPGTSDPAAYLAAPAAIQFQAENDWARVQQACHELLQEARQRIQELTGLPPICPDSPEWYAQMAACPLPPCDAQALQRHLYDEYAIEAPLVDWNGRQLVRISIQAYNTTQDVESLVAALGELLPPGSTQPIFFNSTVARRA